MHAVNDGECRTGRVYLCYWRTPLPVSWPGSLRNVSTAFMHINHMHTVCVHNQIGASLVTCVGLVSWFLSVVPVHCSLPWHVCQQDSHSLEEQAWFQKVLFYGSSNLSKPPPEGDDDVKLIPSLVEKVILPRLRGECGDRVEDDL